MKRYQKISIGFLCSFFFLRIAARVDGRIAEAIRDKYCANITTSADYIVVGVGTAGAPVVEMLTRDKKTSVIALHNGKNLSEDPLIKFSKNALFTVGAGLLGDSELYKTGQTVPQPKADLRELLWVLSLPEGGASSVNAGAWCWGTDELYEKWEAIAGPNWSVKRIRALYKSLEDYHGQTNNPAARGHYGPISVRQFPDPTEVSKKFTQAIIEGAGVPFVLDYNDPKTPIGASTQLQYTQYGPNGDLRESSVTAFLNKDVVTHDGRGVNGRKLRILFEATGLKTIWSGNTAIGVEYFKDGEVREVFAKKGIIICAGLFSSPFLMHSGVGPKEVLNPLGIPVIFDNQNVGKGLADQPRMTLLFSSAPQDTPIPPVDPNGLFNQIAWLPDPASPNRTKRELRFASITAIPGLTVVAFDLCQPRTRGTIKITNSDPRVLPAIDMGYLAESDVQLLIRGFQIYIKNINNAFKTIDPRYQLLFPDPAILDDPVLIADFIRANIASNMHFQSHCRMADLKNGGVVDSNGRVYGVKNLWVADDSISPLDMDGSPMASAYLLGAGVAQLILQGKIS